MKRVMFDDLYTWSVFNEEKQFDFNGFLWVRAAGQYPDRSGTHECR